MHHLLVLLTSLLLVIAHGSTAVASPTVHRRLPQRLETLHVRSSALEAAFAQSSGPRVIFSVPAGGAETILPDPEGMKVDGHWKDGAGDVFEVSVVGYGSRSEGGDPEIYASAIHGPDLVWSIVAAEGCKVDIMLIVSAAFKRDDEYWGYKVVYTRGQGVPDGPQIEDTLFSPVHPIAFWG